MSKPTICGRCHRECLDYTVRVGQRVCIVCIGTELDELLRAVGKACGGGKPGRVTAIRYVERLAKERDEARAHFAPAACDCRGTGLIPLECGLCKCGGPFGGPPQDHECEELFAQCACQARAALEETGGQP